MCSCYLMRVAGGRVLLPDMNIHLCLLLHCNSTGDGRVQQHLFKRKINIHYTKLCMQRVHTPNFSEQRFKRVGSGSASA